MTLLCFWYAISVKFFAAFYSVSTTTFIMYLLTYLLCNIFLRICAIIILFLYNSFYSSVVLLLVALAVKF